MREREVKLAAPPGFEPPVFEPESGMRVVRLEPRVYDTLYLDTPDLRLARWGLQLRHRGGEGWTVKLPSMGEGSVMDREELRFAGDAGEPPAAALDLVQAFVRDAAVAPAAHTRTTRRPAQLRDAAGAALGELVVDEVTVDGDGGYREVEVEIAPEVSDRTLETIMNRLREAGAGPPETTSKYLRALGAKAPAGPELPVTPPGPGAQVTDVIRYALSASVARLLRHDPTVRIGEDTEGVHQARVATRRLRSDIRTFAPLLDEDWIADLRAELRWLGGLLGEARDTDVLLARLRGRLNDLTADDRARAEELLTELSWSADRARSDLLSGMRSPRYIALLDRLIQGARSPLFGPDAVGDELKPGDLLRPMVRHPWAKVATSVQELGERPSDAELHEIRIETKRCRYAADATVPVLGKPARRFAEAAALLQGILGEHQDSVVARRWLRRHGIESGGSFAYAAGQLAASEAAAARAARGAWRSAWRKLTKASVKMGL